MRYIDCLVMSAGLMIVDAPKMKARFSYTVSRNKGLLEPVIKSLEEMVKPTEEHAKFIAERKKILREFAKKDDNGDPIVRIDNVNGQQKETYLIPGISDEKNEFNVKLDKLKKRFKRELDEQESKEKEYNEHLDKVATDFFPIMVDWKLVPEQGLSQQAMDGVFFMVKKETVDPEKPVAAKKPAPK